MKRVLALLLGAFVVVWTAALVDFSDRGAVAPAREAAVVAQARPASPEAPQQVASKPAAPLAEVAASPTTAPSAPAAVTPMPKASVVGTIVRAAQGSVAVVGKTARAFLTNGSPQAAEPKPSVQAPAAEATGELGQGVQSREFEDYERRYASEPREGDWGPQQEQHVRALLKDQPFADKVALVHCQQTVCRIVIEAEADAKGTFTQLLQVPGLSEATGMRTDTPYSLRTGQLSVYFRNPESVRAQ